MRDLIIYSTLFLIIVACNQAKHESHEQHSETPISDYLRSNLPLFTVVDSIQLHSLNSTVYFVDYRHGIDDDDYYIIRDKSTKQLFKIVHGYWPRWNQYLSQEHQLKVLQNDTFGQIVEPVNFEWLGLESFLNNCQALEKKELNPSVVDTIIRFYDKDYVRLTQQSQIDTFINRGILQEKKDKEGYKLYAEQKREIIKKKIEMKNVLLYSYPYDGTSYMIYFEINPGLNTYSLEPPPNYQEDAESEKIFYAFPPSGNNYNLVYLYIY